MATETHSTVAVSKTPHPFIKNSLIFREKIKYRYVNVPPTKLSKK
jgi:hypothetical protein